MSWLLFFGDLKDVAWSRSTLLFRKISGLLNPRLGRGCYSTFHTQYKFLRWPLDHLLHSEEFSLNKIQVLPEVGSDHLPVYAKLELNTKAETQQEEYESSSEEEKMAEDNIEKAFKNTGVYIFKLNSN
jgi:hypothetical protein